MSPLAASRAASALLLMLVLSGCTTLLSGIGGDAQYSCKAPTGIPCRSVSGVYANATAPHAAADLRPAAPLAFASPTTAPAATGRAAPRILSLWIAPWEDAEGDLHEAATVQVLVEPGHWQLASGPARARPRLDAARPPAISTPVATPPAALPASDALSDTP